MHQFFSRCSATVMTCLLGLTIAGSVQTGTAAAAPLPPLKGLPLLYDANNKLIGPYDGYVLLPVKGKYTYLAADSTGFHGRYYVTFLYAKHNCLGKKYLITNSGEPDLIQNGVIVDDTIYLPGADQGIQNVLSQYGPDYSKPGAPMACQDFGNNPQSYPLNLPTTLGVSALGFTAPFHLQSP